MEKMPVSKYVSLKRKQMNLTQKDLAERLYYTPQALSRFESLDSAFPLDQVDALCKALDCSLDELFLRQLDNTHYAPLPFSLDDLGGYLTAHRRFRGISQEDMAEACGISGRSLRNYENGKSRISLQTLDAFCFNLGILPSELSKSLESKPEPEPISKKRKWIPIASIGAVAALVIAFVSIFLTNILKPAPTMENSTSLATSSSPSSSESISITSQAEPSSSDTMGRYGLEIHEGVPNFLAISYPRNVFTAIGDKIVITLTDAYDETTVNLKRRGDWEVSPAPFSPTFELSCARVGPNKIEMTLVSAQNGEGAPLNIFLFDTWHYGLGFFFYRTDETVYIPSDTDHRFPINGGKVHCDFKSEVNVDLKQNNWVQYEVTPLYNGLVHPWDEGVIPEYSHGSFHAATSRFSSHNYPETIYSGSVFGEKPKIEIPVSIEVDDIFIYGYVWVGENQETAHHYCLDPLHIHILR